MHHIEPLSALFFIMYSAYLSKEKIFLGLELDLKVAFSEVELLFWVKKLSGIILIKSRSIRCFRLVKFIGQITRKPQL